MTGVTELGYVRFGVRDVAAWCALASGCVGLEVGADSDDSRVYLRMDQWHHRIVLEPGDEDDLTGIGLRVAGPEEFRALRDTLDAHAVSYSPGDAALARDRHVLELLTLLDPAGNPLEIFHGPRVDAHLPFRPGRGMFGKFVTGDGGLGHVMLAHRGLAETHAFYRLLGMRGSIEYHLPTPDGNTLEILFMHCNSRDHSLAFGPPVAGHLNHIMFEVDNLDDVFLAYEAIKDRYPIAITLGKHANDHMFSFYCVSPAGFLVEVGYGGRPATHQSEYYTRDTYGHEFQIPGAM